MSAPQFLDPWLGRSIGDRHRYRLDQRLGSGGMADVFLAMDTLLGQPVALKLLHEKLAAGAMRARFEREVSLCAALRSDHIVQVSDYGVTPEGYPFYVMEYLRGQTLGQLLRQEKQLPVDRSINIITQVCIGLHLAHQGVTLWQDGATASEPVKIIHRDLKPDNIFLVPTSIGELVKILDFGIAKIRSEQDEQTESTSVFLGTYRYAAPEQFELGQDLDERADIYSLGMLLYEMLSGTDPFGFGGHSRQVSGGTWAVAHLSKPSLPLREQPGCESLPPELEAVVMRCLYKMPDLRFPSVYQLHQALQEAMSGLPDRPLAIAQPAPMLMPTTSLPASLRVSSPLANSQQTTQVKTQDINPVFSTAAYHSAPARPSPRRAVLLKAAAVLPVALAIGLSLYYSSQSSLLSAIQPDGKVIQATEPIVQASQSPPELKSLAGHSDTVWAVAISPDGQTLVSSSFDKTIKLWNLQTGSLIRTLAGHTDAVRAIAISPDGRLLASGGGDKGIKIWDLQTGMLQRTLPGHVGPVWSIAISPDNQTLVSGSYDGMIKIWDLHTGELRRTLPDHYDSVWSVAISPDAQTLASGGYDGAIKLWDLQTGKLRQTLSGHTDAVRAVAIGPDGQTLASASWDKTIKIWNLNTGQPLHTLTGHSDRVLSVAYDPSGKRLASGSLDKTIKLWDVQSGALLRTLSGHSSWVISVAFSPDGQTIASGSRDQTVKIWQIDRSSGQSPAP